MTALVSTIIWYFPIYYVYVVNHRFFSIVYRSGRLSILYQQVRATPDLYTTDKVD